MKTTIVCYTHCLGPKTLIKKTIRDAMNVADKNGWNMVISSHLPVLSSYEDCRDDFRDLWLDSPDGKRLSFLDTWRGNEIKSIGSAVNVVTGILEYSYKSIISQIVHAINRFPDTDRVILWEHDVIYPKGYAESMEKALENNDYALYKDSVFMDDEGYFDTAMQFWYLSRYAARKDALLDCFSKKLKGDGLDNFEPVMKGLVDDSGDDFDSDSYEIVSGPPVIDVKHGSNASGQIIIDKHSRKHPHWGKCDKYVKLVMEEKEYIEYVISNPDVGWGLFISGQKFSVC
jgi:hypothetical protein